MELPDRIIEKAYKQFAQLLQNAMAAHNLPGFDLYEFHQIFIRAASRGESVEDSFYRALSASETMKISVRSLIENYDHYIKVLDQEKDKFNNDIKAFQTTFLQDKNEDIDEETLAQQIVNSRIAFNKAYENIKNELDILAHGLKEI